MNKDVSSNVNCKGLWAAEESSHFLDLCDVIANGRAILNTIVDLHKDITNLQKPIDDIIDIFLLEQCDCIFNILNDISAVCDAFIKIWEFTSNSTDKKALNG